MNVPWLALERFPSRIHLASVAKGMAPTAQRPELTGLVEAALVRQWAERIGRAPETLLPVADPDAAVRLALGAVLAPNDVAVLARPCAAAAPAAVLSLGARFLDLGRLADLRMDPASVARAPELHPDAVWIGEAPHLGGGSDARPDGAMRAWILDCRRGGLPAQAPRPDEAWITALHDLDPEAAPILAAIVGAPATIDALRPLRGPASPPLPLLRAALDRLALPDVPNPAVQARRSERLEQVRLAAAAWPGAVVLHAFVDEVTLRCAADDAEAFAAALRDQGIPAHGYGAHPMRSLVRARLL
ncbi:MAG: hypothetical protein H6747_07105 [Deltaproteobacteria bacterium]|nr:hypothetical protein [Deltaproteobacteria bacterium]